MHCPSLHFSVHYFLAIAIISPFSNLQIIMVSYYSSYIDLANTQQMDYQLVEKTASNDQISSSCSSSSPENFNVYDQVCNNKKPTEGWGEVNSQDQNNLIPFVQQQSLNTIEGFLVKAGRINPQPLMAADSTVVVSQHDDWCKLQSMQQQQVTMAMPIRNDIVVSQFQVCENNNDFGIMSSLMVPMTNNCLENRVDRKVICSSFKEEMMEKTVERRRKRMIKNRESAARSRARKQAHTNQLELEVMELKKTNHWLKRYKEAMKHLSEHSTNNPTYQLRRTSSTSF